MAEVAQKCDLQTGEIIGGRYQVDKTLGEGSFGLVYKVHDNGGNSYAFKLLKLWEIPPDVRDSLSARFKMEFETGRIDCDYLVRSLDYGMMYGNPFIVMEFCDGGDVISYSENHSVNLSKLACHVLYGLDALHKEGKVHRDLKPENVLVKPNGKFALTDFGISGDRNKKLTELNFLGKPLQVFGTYAYMPPEQVKPVKHAPTVLPTTDIFSFGVMIYQLLTGELPFGKLEDQGDLVPYIKNGKSGNWDRGLLRRSCNGQKWEHLIEGCLQPDYTKRIQTVTQVLDFVPDKDFADEQQKPPIIQKSFSTSIKNGLKLKIMQGEEYGKEYFLTELKQQYGQILRIGRQDETVFNEINIVERQSSYISRMHCCLEFYPNTGAWVLRDGQWRNNCNRATRTPERYPCGSCPSPCNGMKQWFWKNSLNGSFLNSQEVSQNGMIINPGDIISIGDTKIRVEAY
ncbi:MAG: protein kinase [Bacteroidales bacterium]|nr:protein kinase [Bacteroidales bacterium]